jgi:hypothetical protein
MKWGQKVNPMNVRDYSLGQGRRRRRREASFPSAKPTGEVEGGAGDHPGKHTASVGQEQRRGLLDHSQAGAGRAATQVPWVIKILSCSLVLSLSSAAAAWSPPSLQYHPPTPHMYLHSPEDSDHLLLSDHPPSRARGALTGKPHHALGLLKTFPQLSTKLRTASRPLFS